MMTARAIQTHRRLTIRVSTLFLTVAVIILAFENLLAAATNMSLFRQLSHLVVLPTFTYVVVKAALQGQLSRMTFALIGALLLLVLIGATGAHSRGFLITTVASLLYLKIAYILIISRDLEVSRMNKLLVFLTIVHLLGILISFIFYNTFFTLRSGDVLDRTQRILGFQLNSNALGFMSATLALYFQFIRKRNLLAFILVGTVLWSGSRSALMLYTLAALYLAGIEGRLRGKVLMIAVVVVAAIGAAVMNERLLHTLGNVQQTLDGDGLYSRIAMMVGGYTLALRYFPVASGGGTFGSPLGTGPDAYVDVGIYHLPGIYDGSDIHDSGIGSLLGEYGFSGFALVALLLAGLIRSFGNGAYRQKDIVFFVGLIFFLSLFRGIISNYYYAACLTFFGLILRSLRRQQQNGPRP